MVAEVAAATSPRSATRAPWTSAWYVDRVGTSSVVYRVGLFQGPEGPGDEAAAEGRFVHVYVDNTDPARPVLPIPEAVRAAVAPLSGR